MLPHIILYILTFTDKSRSVFCRQTNVTQSMVSNRKMYRNLKKKRNRIFDIFETL